MASHDQSVYLDDPTIAGGIIQEPVVTQLTNAESAKSVENIQTEPIR